MKGSCSQSNIIVRRGFAYSVKSSGLANFKISSLYYVNMALRNLQEFSFCAEEWQRLEAMTQLMILCGPCKATLDSKPCTIPRATAQICQEEIGDLPENLHEEVVTLFKLAAGHNIDFILYDKRGTPDSVYFIQTSKSNYGVKKNKKKDKTALSRKVMSSATVKSEVSIQKHYTFEKENVEIFYVFATTDVATWY